MDKDSVMYLLMDMRVNGVLDRILEKDEEYQGIAKKSGEYLDRLEEMDLPHEARSLIDKHSCEQNALGARYGALAYLLGFLKGTAGSCQGQAAPRTGSSPYHCHDLIKDRRILILQFKNHYAHDAVTSFLVFLQILLILKISYSAPSFQPMASFRPRTKSA
ncbi:MAG: hypothetical protein NC121_20150 [Blautia sp.]|nr:hypothetical protein [Blautia sp.]